MKKPKTNCNSSKNKSQGIPSTDGIPWDFFSLTKDIMRIQNQLSLLLLQFVPGLTLKWLDYDVFITFKSEKHQLGQWCHYVRIPHQKLIQVTQGLIHVMVLGSRGCASIGVHVKIIYCVAAKEKKNNSTNTTIVHGWKHPTLPYINTNKIHVESLKQAIETSDAISRA